ncbi:MAG: hypothetical protein AB7L84_11520 [Acidimicrobiia bacterium]
MTAPRIGVGAAVDGGGEIMIRIGGIVIGVVWTMALIVMAWLAAVAWRMRRP